MSARLTEADWQEVLADHQRLVRRLDVALNGEAGAAKQASLCDIVSQVERLAALAGPLEQPQEQKSDKANLAQASGGDDLQTALPRFDKTYCSQCGGEFGAGNEGYGHCSDHSGQRNRDNDCASCRGSGSQGNGPGHGGCTDCLGTGVDPQCIEPASESCVPDSENVAMMQVTAARMHLASAIDAYEAAGFGSHVANPLRDALKLVDYSISEVTS